LSWDAKISPGGLWLTIDGKGVTAQADRPLQPLSYSFLVLGNSPRDADKATTLEHFGEANVDRMSKDLPEDKDIFPLEGIVDEIRISDETLGDRARQNQGDTERLPVDWALYQQVEDMVRMILYRLWPNDLPLDTELGGKYGGVVAPGWYHLAMYESFGDLWFLHQAERVGEILLLAQGSAGQFPTAVKMTSGGKLPQDLGPAESGVVSAGPASWSEPNHARIQDGYQDVPMAYLIYLYRLTGKEQYLDAARSVGDLFIEAQNPNGSWSGLYDVELKKGLIADNHEVLQGGEFDDGAIRRPFWSLLLLYHVTKDEKYLSPLVKCADWIINAEIVWPGARGWAAFYDTENNPVQARAHELPYISSKVFPQDVGHIMMWTYFLTGDRKYLDAIRPALKWYQEHRTERGWPAFYDKEGTPIAPSNWYSGEGWYGPEYGHFTDITYIEEAIARLDNGSLQPNTGSLEPTEEALEKARAEAIQLLKDSELLRWVERDVQLAPQAQWVRYRPRYQPQLYGIQAYGDLAKLIEYLQAVRIAANKVPPSTVVAGAPMPDSAPLAGIRGRCWVVEDWFDTPLGR
ncbi:MAG: pectate lyase, partial [bacterium]